MLIFLNYFLVVLDLRKNAKFTFLPDNNEAKPTIDTHLSVINYMVVNMFDNQRSVGGFCFFVPDKIRLRKFQIAAQINSLFNIHITYYIRMHRLLFGETAFGCAGNLRELMSS